MNLGSHTPRLSLLMRSEFPTARQSSSKKTITPYQKARKNDIHTPKNKKSNTKSSNQKTVTNEEFRSMLEIKEKVSPTVPSLLGQSLFDLSLCLRPLEDVLDQIKIFKYNAPLHLYRYSSLIKLLSAAVKCPPDATLLLLTIGGKMIKKDNYAKPDYLNELIKITKNQITNRYKYESYKDQKIPQKKLIKLLNLFRGALNMPQKQPEGTYGTREIEQIMEKEQEEKKLKSPLEEETPRHRKKKIKITPMKNISNSESDDEDIGNEKMYDSNGNVIDLAVTPVRRSTNPNLLPVRTPDTGTPRKAPPSSSKKRKSAKVTPRSTKPIKSNKQIDSINATPRDIKIGNTNSKQDDKKDDLIDKDNNKKLDDNNQGENNKRPILNIYDDLTPKSRNSDVNKNEENTPLKKSGDKLGRSIVDFNNIQINAEDFGGMARKKFQKSPSATDVTALLNPATPKLKRKSTIDPNLTNLPIELDFHSSTLNSSSFLNIIGTAVNDFDDNASQTTTQSGKNSISKELRDVLFNGDDSESSELHLEGEPKKRRKKNQKNTSNDDLYLQAKRLATVTTYDADEFEAKSSEMHSDEIFPHKKKHPKILNNATVYSSETSAAFKNNEEEEEVEDDEDKFFGPFKSPSEAELQSGSSENDSRFKKLRPPQLNIESYPRNPPHEEEEDDGQRSEVHIDGNEEEEEGISGVNHKVPSDMTSLSEIPDSVDDYEDINSGKAENKPKPTKVPKLVLESLQNNADSVSLFNSIPSNRLSTNGTSPCSANLSSDYSPGASTSPRRLDSTGIIDIIELKPKSRLASSNQVHIDIKPDPSISSGKKNSVITIENIDQNDIGNETKKKEVSTVKDRKITIDNEKVFVPSWSSRNVDESETNNDNIWLEATKSSKKFWSVEKFLASTGNIYQRRERGAELYENLNQQQLIQISKLAKLFKAWNTAYSSSKVVWDVMKSDDKFDIDVLLSQIPISYGDFLIEGLNTFAKNEGISLKKLSI